MNDFNSLKEAIISGRNVYFEGNRVSLKGRFNWSDKSLWIMLPSGVEFKAEEKEISEMYII